MPRKRKLEKIIKTINKFTRFSEQNIAINGNIEIDSIVDKVYHDLKNQISRNNKIVSEREILPFLTENIGDLNFKKITKYYGKTKSVYTKTVHNKKVDIRVFRIISQGFRAKILVHYHKNVVFCISYVYRVLSDKDIGKILLHKGIDNIDYKNEYLTDNTQTIVTFSKDLYFNINYYNTKSDIFKVLT